MMYRSKNRSRLSAVCLALVLPAARSAAAAPAAESADGKGTAALSPFAKVRPILEENCLGCHGAKAKKQSGLDLGTRERLLPGGDRGPALVPGDAKNSLLYRTVTWAEKPHMPHEDDKLSDKDIAVIAEWIN